MAPVGLPGSITGEHQLPCLHLELELALAWHRSNSSIHEMGALLAQKHATA